MVGAHVANSTYAKAKKTLNKGGDALL